MNKRVHSTSHQDNHKPLKKQKLTSQHFSQLCETCIKLFHENKIDHENSWRLNLIDYIDQIIDSPVEQIDFAKARFCQNQFEMLISIIVVH